MFKVIFSSGITGFILGILTCGLYFIFKKKRDEEREIQNKAAEDFLNETGKTFEVEKFDF